MTPALLYIARASLYLAIFYAFYLLIMRKTSLFRFNRVVLLVGTVVCHLLPLLRLRTVIVPDFSSIQVGELQMVGVGAEEAAAAHFPWLLALYLAGAASVVAASLLSIARTRRIIRSGSPEPCEGCRLTLVDRDVPSFSWGRMVVMSRQDYEKYPAILRHELQHIHAHHSLDVLLMTAVNAIHWFNPLAWIARAELRLLHEYEADEGLIRQGIDATSYQLLLVRKAVGEQRFSLANGFNHAKLKQRIAMMHKKPTSGWMRLAYVALLPFLAGTMFLCNPARAEIRPAASPADTPAEALMPAATTVADPTVQLPERAPKFQGGDVEAFANWVRDHMVYPKEAHEDGIQGRVMVQYAIDTDGTVCDVKVMRGVHELLDAEAVRVVSSSPKWEPAIQDGKPVKITFMIPLVFKLNGDDPAPATSTISIRKADGAGDPLIYLDGKEFTGNIGDIDASTIESMEVLKDAAAVEKYGDEAKNGVILIKSKKQ
jgi:TonB family protein